MSRVTLRRHGWITVAAHAIFGFTMLALAATGILITFGAPHWLAVLLGGHDGIVTWHRRLGISASVALLVVPILAPHRTAGLIRDVFHMRRTDLGWAKVFMRFAARPSRTDAPYHDGRFDPGQRALFALIGALLAALVVTGMTLVIVPRGMPTLLAANVRIHNLVSWAFIGAVGLHILAGSGLLPSHRGVARAMIDGRVQQSTASRLWPAWTRRHNTPPRCQHPQPSTSNDSKT